MPKAVSQLRINAPMRLRPSCSMSLLVSLTLIRTSTIEILQRQRACVSRPCTSFACDLSRSLLYLNPRLQHYLSTFDTAHHTHSYSRSQLTLSHRQPRIATHYPLHRASIEADLGQHIRAANIPLKSPGTDTHLSTRTANGILFLSFVKALHDASSLYTHCARAVIQDVVCRCIQLLCTNISIFNRPTQTPAACFQPYILGRT